MAREPRSFERNLYFDLPSKTYLLLFLDKGLGALLVRSFVYCFVV